MRSFATITESSPIGPMSRRHRRLRRGYGLVELIVATLLSSLLGVVMALACATFARPALEVEARARIAQEATLAAQSLACDLGGYLADAPGRLGDPEQYQFSEWAFSTPGMLLLNFQGSTSSDSIFISYQLSGNELVRYNTSTGITTTIAKYVTSFIVTDDTETPGQIQIQFTVAFRYFTATYTLIGMSPPS